MTQSPFISRLLRTTVCLALVAAAASTAGAWAQDEDGPATGPETGPPARETPEAGEKPEPAATPPAPSPATQAEAADPGPSRYDALIAGLTIFALAIFVGFEVIAKVPPTLHTPLMSGSNAISGITIVGAVIVAAKGLGVAPFMGLLALMLAMVNVVGGFLVTHRMLSMFKKK